MTTPTHTRRARLVITLALLAALTSGCGMIVDVNRTHYDTTVWEPTQATEVAPDTVQDVAVAACRESLEHAGTRPQTPGADYKVVDLEFNGPFHRYEQATYQQKFTGDLFWPDYETERLALDPTHPGWVAEATYTLQPTGTPARDQMPPTTRTQDCLYQQTDADEPTSAQWGPRVGIRPSPTE